MATSIDKNMSPLRPIKKLNETLYSQKMKKESLKQASQNNRPKSTRGRERNASISTDISGIPNRASEFERKYKLSELEIENAKLSAEVAALRARDATIEDLQEEVETLKGLLEKSEKVRAD